VSFRESGQKTLMLEIYCQKRATSVHSFNKLFMCMGVEKIIYNAFVSFVRCSRESKSFLLSYFFDNLLTLESIKHVELLKVCSSAKLIKIETIKILHEAFTHTSPSYFNTHSSSHRIYIQSAVKH
jgi:hypothetical protein